MSVATAPPAGSGTVAPGPPAPPPPSEACPLCGAPLHPAQEWCIRCGAAARTRLAASPNWKRPVAVLATVVALSLGVIAAALVALAGDSSTAGPTNATTPVNAATPTQTGSVLGGTAPSGTAPGTTTPGTTTPGTTTPGTSTSGTSSSGAIKPGTSIPNTGEPHASVPKTLPTPKHNGTSTTPGSGSARAKLSPKARVEIERSIAERLRKSGVGKVLPGTATR